MCKLKAFIEEMARTDQIFISVNFQKIQDDLVKLWNIVKSQPEISEERKESKDHGPFVVQGSNS